MFGRARGEVPRFQCLTKETAPRMIRGRPDDPVHRFVLTVLLISTTKILCRPIEAENNRARNEAALQLS